MFLRKRKAKPVTTTLDMRKATPDTRHVVCITCGDPATHITAVIRPRGLAAKVYPFCNGCDDLAYHLAPHWG